MSKGEITLFRIDGISQFENKFSDFTEFEDYFRQIRTVE
jgi:hypothetical protein